jgi:hypothetical protein
MKSTDTDAVNGSRGRCSATQGDGILLLDEILLNGYNWQQITAANLTRSGTTATLNLTSHGFRDAYQRLWVTNGDTQDPIYSDTVYATVVTANQITYTVTNTGATTGAASGSTTANGAISSTTVTSITVTSAASFPASGYYAIKIDTEWMLVTSGQGTVNWTVQRGFGNSTAATHSNGATVTQVILIGVAPAGGSTPWTKPYTATNKATYRMAAGNQRYMYIDDTIDGANGRSFAVRGFETQTSLAVGSNPFPNLQSNATAGNFVKNNTASNATARPWWAFVSDRMIYLQSDCANSGFSASLTRGGCLIFGDLINLSKSGDTYATVLCTSTAGDITGATATMYLNSISNNTINGICRPSFLIGKGFGNQQSRYAFDFRTQLGQTAGLLTFPHPPDGGFYLSQVGHFEQSGSIFRGLYPGLWYSCHVTSAGNHGDIFQGTGNLLGKTFMLFYTAPSGVAMFFEVSQTVTTT